MTECKVIVGTGLIAHCTVKMNTLNCLFIIQMGFMFIAKMSQAACTCNCKKYALVLEQNK